MKPKDTTCLWVDKDAHEAARSYDATVPGSAVTAVHNDYHMWDDHEDQAYRQYVGDQHMRYRGYSKLSRKQQTSYWKWRHTQGGDK
jgi:hypothetical protein